MHVCIDRKVCNKRDNRCKKQADQELSEQELSVLKCYGRKSPKFSAK